MSNKEQLKNSAEIYLDVRSKLIEARFETGLKMKPEKLRQDYACAASTVREVLFRLASDGFLDFEDQRGFRVVTCNIKSLQELTELRILLEAEGAKRSILLGDIEWEARLTAAHHKLAHIEKKIQSSTMTGPIVTSWNNAEWEFHATLLSACGSDLMRQQHKIIYDRFRQHLLNLKNQHGFRSTNLAEHKAIVDAVVARDAQNCSLAISEHLLANLT